MSVRSRLQSIAVDDRAWGVRDRLKLGFPALVVFILSGLVVDPAFWTQWWFYVGLGLFLSGVFFEPFFGTPRTTIANTAGAVGAFWSAERGLIEPLWIVYFAVALALLTSALLATVLPGQGRFKALSNRIATWGSASTLGSAALLLECANRIGGGDLTYAILAIGVVVLLVGVRLRWSAVVGGRASAFPTPVLVDSLGPSLLLFEGASSRSGVLGSGVTFGDGTLTGSVVAHMPGPSGVRTVIAVDGSWDQVASRMPEAVRIQGAETGPSLLGLASEGTTVRRLEFPLLGHLEIGAPVSLGDDESVLYQVVGERLADYSWDESKALLPTATAMQIGRIVDGELRRVNVVPRPHAPVRAAYVPAGSGLPANYLRLGTLRGTDFAIGISLESRKRGHVAVLGMSGMGKTSTTERICKGLGAVQHVIAVDVTGEYRATLGFPTWVSGDFRPVGFAVHEPAGDPAQQANAFVKQAMTEGKRGYDTGAIVPRLICLEEAHSFVPEWNFASRPEADASSLTARYVMQARKFGLTFLIVSQRSAVVSKSVLSQCESIIAFRSIDETALSFLETVMGSEARDILPNLARYEALCFGPGFNSDGPVVVTMEAPVARAPLAVAAGTAPPPF